MAREAVAESFKFDINAFADAGGVQAASARNALRRAEITPQNGNKYGWKSKTEMAEDWDSIRANGGGEAKSNGKKVVAKSAKRTTAKATVRKPAKKVAAAKKAAPRRSKRQEADNGGETADSGE
jgi:hypothetical protein